MSSIQRPLIPDQVDSEESNRRFEGGDIGGLSDFKIWAELTTLVHALACHLFARDAGRIVGFAPDYAPISNEAWLRDRIQRLRAEATRRRRARRAS